MSDSEIIMLPKETVSDDRYLILTILPSGARVSKNEILLEFQTSKATMELVSPLDGYFHTWVSAGQQLPVGTPLGVVSRDAVSPKVEIERMRVSASDATQASASGPAGFGGGEVRFSKLAEELIVRHGLHRELFTGIKLVRGEDVERVLAAEKSTAAHKSGATQIVLEGGESSVIIFGGGGHAKICIDIMRLMGLFKIEGVLDAGMEIGSTVLDVPVIGGDADMDRFHADGVRMAVSGLGAAANHPTRAVLFEKIKAAGFKIPNLIHPSAVIERSAKLGEGNQVMAGAIIGSEVTIGSNCIVNAGAVVAHDSVLADNVHIAPGAILGGSVKVGSDTLIGMGATIYFGLSIGSRVIVANGVNVFATVPDGSILRH